MDSNYQAVERKEFSPGEEVERFTTAITRWKIFAVWSGLALIGQAASLQLIDAGRAIHFQHYKTLPQLFEQNRLPLILFAFQIVFVAAAVSRNWTEIKNRLNRNFKRWQLIFAALFLILAGAAVTREVSIYATSLAFAAVVQTINLANVWLAARSAPNDLIVWLKGKVKDFFGDFGAQKNARLDRFSMFAALWIVLLAGFLSFFVYENHPHVPDETQYLFQAKYFAAGHLSVVAPPVPEAFAMYMTPTNEPRWFSIFPPGWSAILAIGVKLNLVWLVNPLLGGLCVLLVYLFFQEIYSRKTARISILLLCCSPWFVFMAMSFMSHTATLVCALGAAVWWLRGVKNQRASRVFAAGLCIGILSLIRPLDAAVVAVLLGAWTLFVGADWKIKIVNAAVLVAGTFTTAALIFPYNRAVTGSALVSPMDFYYAKYFWAGVNSYGFGATRGFGWSLDAFPGHSPLEAVLNAALNVFQTNTELFGWATGSLIFVVYYIFSGNFRKKDFWAFAAVALAVVAFGGFWYHGGPDFGARYWFLIIVPLVALTARGIEICGAQTVEGENDGETNLNPRVVLAAMMLCALSILNFFPWRALDKYHRYLEMQPGIEQLARENDFGRSLVLIRGAEHPDFQSAWIYNPLDFDANAPIFVREATPETVARLKAFYADRPLWIVNGPTLTGGDYQIAENPIYANTKRLAEPNP